jgi:hypothetical protein
MPANVTRKPQTLLLERRPHDSFYQKPFICILTSAHIIPSFHPSSTSIPLCYLRHTQTSNHIGMSPHLQITP